MGRYEEAGEWSLLCSCSSQPVEDSQSYYS